jgi:parallel beta-helix repeat protein
MSGFNLTSVSNVTIRNLNITGFGYGIYLQTSTLNSIVDNNITANEGNIYFEDSFDNTLTGNTITDGAEAIQLVASSNNTISGNRLSHNFYGVWSRFNSAENVIAGNNITRSNRGIFLDTSSNNALSGNRIADISEGIAVDNSSNNVIAGNSVTRGTQGIYVKDNSRHNTITGNNIDNNTRGIQVQQSSFNTIVGNNITRNRGYGVLLFAYISNTFSHNTFLGNAQHVGTYLPSVHVWDAGYPSGGNYWSNYTGADSNHDGIGDTPHVIDANNTDHYPLMGPFHRFNTTLGLPVNVVSNSTIERFQYFESNSTIKMYVSNRTLNQAVGFCRVRLPKGLMSPPYTVMIDEGLTAILHFNDTIDDNGTHRWIYFAYEHSTREIDIVPEFPTWTSTLLILIGLTVATALYKRRLLKTPIH